MTDLKMQWEMNEKLLQQYRLISILSQSVNVLIGAVLLTAEISKWGYVFITVVFLFITWGIWFPVLRSRALLVDYYKYQVLQNKPAACSAKEYIHDRSKRKEFNLHYDVSKNFRVTRMQLDRILPGIYSLVWLIFVLEKLF